ncbi:hypothetical protein MUK42_06913, partial [Musa troglodytarum]
MPHHPMEVSKVIQPVPLFWLNTVILVRMNTNGRQTDTDANSDMCASRPPRRGEGNPASNANPLASLMAEPMRVRVEFEDHRRLLTKSQRKDGLRRCWILLGPHIPTVADLAAHLARSFALDRSCPRGICLYMDEFVLPPFESTSIFRDKDIIRRKKLNPTNTEKPIITAEPDENVQFEKNERF